MIPLIPAILATKAGLDILQKAKGWFSDTSIGEAEALLGKRLADDVGSLQEQVRTHRQVMDKLVEQVKADKEMLEKHNEVLIHLSESVEQVATALEKLRLALYTGIGLAGLSLLVAVLFKVLK